ncbi:MAG: hypothetical protein JWN86_4368 [Planctomycetota bacterium]|nr:hypothetical protein [Planctomycetota bacterium]
MTDQYGPQRAGSAAARGQARAPRPTQGRASHRPSNRIAEEVASRGRTCGPGRFAPYSDRPRKIGRGSSSVPHSQAVSSRSRVDFGRPRRPAAGTPPRRASRDPEPSLLGVAFGRVLCQRSRARRSALRRLKIMNYNHRRSVTRGIGPSWAAQRARTVPRTRRAVGRARGNLFDSNPSIRPPAVTPSARRWRSCACLPWRGSSRPWRRLRGPGGPRS